MEELNKSHYWLITGQYTYHMVVNLMKTNKGELLQTEVHNYLEGRPEKADTLTRHPDCLLCKRFPGNVLVRSTNTDVLATLLRLVDVPVVSSSCLLVVRFQNL